MTRFRCRDVIASQKLRTRKNLASCVRNGIGCGRIAVRNTHTILHVCICAFPISTYDTSRREEVLFCSFRNNFFILAMRREERDWRFFDVSHALDALLFFSNHITPQRCQYPKLFLKF